MCVHILVDLIITDVAVVCKHTGQLADKSICS